MWWMTLALAACEPDWDTTLKALDDTDPLTVQAVDEALACHTDPLTPERAARLHTLYARAADDAEQAAEHLYAAWEAQPFAPPPLPPEHPAMALLGRLQEAPTPPPTPSLEAPSVDGQPSSWTRGQHPFLAQRPGTPPVRVVPPPPEPDVRQGPPKGWGWAAIAGGLAATAIGVGVVGSFL